MDIQESLSLVTSQYKEKPNFTRWLTAGLKKIVEIGRLTDDFLRTLSLDKATGVQLDKIGELLNLPRALPWQPETMASSVMDDETYRFALKGAIAKAQWDGTRKGLENILKQILPDTKIEIIDNQNMSIDVLVISKDMDEKKKELLFHDMVIPRPEGVEMNYQVQAGTIFGWDKANELLDGWDKAIWL